MYLEYCHLIDLLENINHACLELCPSNVRIMIELEKHLYSPERDQKFCPNGQ